MSDRREVWVAEDWAAVAAAISDRVRELGWRQRHLAQRSHVSQAIVRELQHHTVERRHSPRTLAALSTALGWHPTHLDEVLHGRAAPSSDRTTTPMIATVAPACARLDRVQQHVDEHLREIATRLDALTVEVRTALDHLRRR